MKNYRRFPSLISVLLTILALAELANAHYNPRLGRFMSRDPIEERGGTNIYSFVRNEPINHMDTLGLYTRTDAWKSLLKNGVKPLGSPSSLDGPGSKKKKYSDTQIFDEWLKLEKADSVWLSTIPQCPDKICVIEGKPKRCDKSKWGKLSNDG